ncbi:MAG: hypothetical protein AB1486_31725 [Planctomycetota bacterium]
MIRKPSRGSKRQRKGERDGEAPIARRLIAGIRKQLQSNVFSLKGYEKARANIESLRASLSAPDGLASLDPAHALYAMVHNLVTTILEDLTALPELESLAGVIEAAHEEYMPSGPPWSPLTNSYFSCWAYYDLAEGRSRETLGTCLLAAGRELGMDPSLLELIGVLQKSRMGIFRHEGVQDGRTVLREFVTGSSHRCLVPTGYAGREGEIWLARVLPPRQPRFDYSVVFTTPYLILWPGEDEWRRYFDRTIGTTGDHLALHENLMKYGFTRHYWNEYVFEAYANHTSEVIFLLGLPDVASTRPHSPEGEKKFFGV